MVNEELKKSPENPKAVNGENREGLFSPRFKSVAAMAGWDEEALLIASFVVEETPDRQLKQKKLTGLQHFVTPPTNSRRKRRAQKRSPASIRVAVIDLDDDDTAKTETEKKKLEQKFTGKGDKAGDEASEEHGSCVSSYGSAILCTDRLREELSCAICLEICFEPSTTPCGHSFCRKCLQSAADICGMRCPKCRQLISNGRSCTVNTVLWNTIQLLFPKEVESRQEAGDLNSKEGQHQNPARNGDISLRTSIELPPSQDEDAAWALQLQREEYSRGDI
uniref:RING-type E3 ubiquitin transferase n=1 Tax=Solanum tuberosum TaxID=4113 RepID=M1A9S7_SOLTU